MSELEPPPDELKDLFAAERAAPRVDPSARAALRARLTTAVGSAPLGHAAAGAALGGASKVLATIAIIVAAGAATVALVKHGSSAPRLQPAPALVTSAPPAVSAEPPPAVVEAPSIPVVDAQPTPVASTPHVVTNVAPTASATPTALTIPAVPSEADLLRRAWTALSAGQANIAYALTAQDARLHPDGALSEERDAVEVFALAKLHRTDEARAAGARFIAHYPASVHRARVETAMQNEETP